MGESGDEKLELSCLGTLRAACAVIWPRFNLAISTTSFLVRLYAAARQSSGYMPGKSDGPGCARAATSESGTACGDQRVFQHHIMWIIPNYGTDEGAMEFHTLMPEQKFKLAFDDSFDPTAFVVAGVFAGTSMAMDQYQSFGQGAKGFSKYYGGAFADQAISNMMTESIFRTILHQDPRYFTKGEGSFLKRTGYAISREFISRNDDGRNYFNSSKLMGNTVAAGISNLYYPAADRSPGKTAEKWAQQISPDTALNVMKEFWPDVRRKLFGR
jgi:hypothetical protein